jgi:hypothetical protein
MEHVPNRSLETDNDVPATPRLTIEVPSEVNGGTAIRCAPCICVCVICDPRVCAPCTSGGLLPTLLRTTSAASGAAAPRQYLKAR